MNELLVLPDWVYEEMMATKAIDGRQKETFDNVTGLKSCTGSISKSVYNRIIQLHVVVVNGFTHHSF